jgi:hypothetical protein
MVSMKDHNLIFVESKDSVTSGAIRISFWGGGGSATS